MAQRVESWIKDLRSPPSHAGKEKAAQAGKADGSLFSKFAGAAGREGDGTFSQLLACCRALEGQLRALQAGHAELRQETHAVVRYLDRSGVLPSQELEKELENFAQGVGAARSAVPRASGQRGAGHEQLQTPEPPPPPPQPAHLRRGSAGPAAAAAAPKRDWDGRHSPSPRARGRSVDPLQQRAASSPRVAVRGRSASARRPAVERVGSRQRSRSARSPEEGEGAPDAELFEGGLEVTDLYSTLQPLLETVIGTPEQIRLMRALQAQLRSSPEPPNSWSGPGTPLNAAVRAGRSEVVRLLLRARACPNARDHKGVSALHLAVFEGSQDMVQMLLSARGDIDACDRHGQTPLFFAPSRDVCKLLMDRRADATLLNRKGQTALHLAGRAGLYEVLACLSTRVSKQVSELKDVHGVTARDYLQQLSAPQQASMSAMCRGNSNAKRGMFGTPTKDLHAAAQPKRTALSRLAGQGKSRSQTDLGGGHERDEYLSHQQLAQRHAASALPGATAHSDVANDEECDRVGVHPALHDTTTQSSLDGQVGARRYGDWSRDAEHFYLSNGSDQERGQTGPASPESPVPLEVMYSGLDGSRANGPEGELVRAAVGKTALEAAAAVATAAMATAAELDVKAEPERSSAAETGVAPAEEEQEEGAASEAAAEAEAAAAEPCQDPGDELVTANNQLTMLEDELQDVF